MRDSPQITRSPQAVLVSLLPLATSQAYLIWLMANEDLNYFQAMVVNLPEIWLVMLSSMLFFSNSFDVFAKRLGKQFAITGSLFVLFVILLFAGTPNHMSGVGNQPIDRMRVFADASLSAEFGRQALIYIAINLGLSLLLAVTSRTPARNQYQNVVVPSFAVFFALFLSLFLFFTSGLRSDTPQLWETVMLMALFAVLRLVIVCIIQAKSTDAQLEDDYKSFVAGKE